MVFAAPTFSWLRGHTIKIHRYWYNKRRRQQALNVRVQGAIGRTVAVPVPLCSPLTPLVPELAPPYLLRQNATCVMIVTPLVN